MRALVSSFSIVCLALAAFSCKDASESDNINNESSGTDTAEETSNSATSTAESTDEPTATQGETGGDSDTDPNTTEGHESVECESVESWIDASAYDQVQATKSGQLCCKDLGLALLNRIDKTDDSETGPNAVLAVSEQAEQDASEYDQQRDTSKALLCAAILVKDNIDTRGMANTAGSLAMAENEIQTDAPVVQKLREAGALILGKANLSEWANYRGQRSTSGWSSLGGQTHNGFNPDYNPCGSSSGSAAAVAAGLSSAAIGTETAGSITCPAAVNGIVGFKPTIGLISRTGIIPISHTFDTAGPMTQTVKDAALLLSVMAGPDSEDPATQEIPSDFNYDFVASLDNTSFEGKTLGYDVSVLRQYSQTQQQAFMDELERMADAGAEIKSIRMPNAFSFSGSFSTVLRYEFKADLNTYLQDHASNDIPASLGELITFNDDNADEVMPHFGQEFFLDAEQTSGLDNPDYTQAREQVLRQAGPEGLVAVLDSQSLDAIVLPTTGPAWKTNYSGGDALTPSAAFWPAAARCPHLTVPMGSIDDLPVGLSFMGRPWEDAKVLQLGHAYEQL